MYIFVAWSNQRTLTNIRKPKGAEIYIYFFNPVML